MRITVWHGEGVNSKLTVVLEIEIKHVQKLDRLREDEYFVCPIPLPFP